MSYQNVTGTLNPGGHPGSYNGQDAYNDMLITGDAHEKDAFMHRGGETAQTLDASYYKGPGARNGKEREIIAEEPIMMSDRKGHNGITDDGTATTLTAQEKERPLVGASIVRRLTPKECERLQGMPDDWSRYGINENGEVYELSDSARYRLQGNGIATPFWRWLMKRISAQYERTPTLGSLFDGQASFPMIWEGINGPGTAIWSSEIEKHAIAVAKYHFPEGAAHIAYRFTENIDTELE